MARIRTIKPEFFTSEDIVSLSAMARLLYVALWCEADREGRIQWKPKTFKMRYFPADKCDMEALCNEIVARGLVVLYGDGLAYIPSFSSHQHINPRESKSVLPEPTVDNSRVTHASARVTDAQVGKEGKEGKGKEGVGASDDASISTRSPKGSRLAADWVLPKQWGEWAMAEQPTWTADHCRQIGLKFGNYWQTKTGKDATKLDWFKTWQNWVITEGPMKGSHQATTQGAPIVSPAIAQTAQLLDEQKLTPEQIEANRIKAAEIRKQMSGLLKVVA